MNIRNCDLPRCPNITVDELHRHLAVDNLDDVHRGRNRCGTSHWRHSASSVLSALRVISDVQETHAACQSPLCGMVCTCTYVLRETETGRKGWKRRETERNWERDTRTQRRISGVPLLRSRYDARCRAGFALINDTSVYRAVCLTRIDPVEWLPNIASMNTVHKSTLLYIYKGALFQN